MTNECDVLREEIAMLSAENRRLLNENQELRKAPVYPEAAVRAVWWHGVRNGWDTARRYKFVTDDDYDYNAEEVAHVFTEALRDA